MPESKSCEKCGGTFLIVEFRRRATRLDGRDLYCLACRKAVNATAKEKYNYKNRNLKPRTAGADDMDRSKRPGFEKYMANNPHYFQTVFEMEATPENISAAFTGLQKLSLHQVFMQGARLEVADGEISSVREY